MVVIQLEDITGYVCKAVWTFLDSSLANMILKSGSKKLPSLMTQSKRNISFCTPMVVWLLVKV